MIESVLIANRGEIACRIIRTCRRLGIRTVALHSEVDANTPHVRAADESVEIGPAPAAQSYLDVEAVLRAARDTGVDAIHPGYGFLSESAEFARRVCDEGLIWIGPEPASIIAMGDKITARNRMEGAGVPVAPGTKKPVSDVAEALRVAEQIGYPVMVKAAAGGGGIGMSVVDDESSLAEAYASASGRAERFFASADILIEKYIRSARHVEVQVLGLNDGTAVALGERDCSVQRRMQKVLEETPSPHVDPELRDRMLRAGERAAEAIDYRGAGTVEFLVDTSTGDFIFLEMNTRLQVEHPITEMVTGLDLVEEQLRIASGMEPSFSSVPAPTGHALEFRVYAEDPVRFLPGPGTITRWVEPEGDGVRVDAGYAQGDEVTTYYDPLLAKLVTWAPDRVTALERLRAAAAGFIIEGPKVNLALVDELLDYPDFSSGHYDTGVIAEMRSSSTAARTA